MQKNLFEELLSPESLVKSVKKEFNYPASCVAINNGNENFTIKELPCANSIFPVECN
jgi:hypothetical protein